MAIILAAVIYVGYQFTTLQCGAGTAAFLAFIVLGVVPAVYLSLMYLGLLRANPRASKCDIRMKILFILNDGLLAPSVVTTPCGLRMLWQRQIN